MKAAIIALNGYELLLGNNALRHLDSIHITYPEEGNAVFSTKPEAEEIEKVDKVLGTISNHDLLTVPAMSIITITVDVILLKWGSRATNQILGTSNNVLNDKGYSVGRLLLPND